MQRITTFLTFDARANEAVEFYTAVFKNSSVNRLMKMPGTDKVLHASITLDGQDFMLMDGGESFSFAPGFSLFVRCSDQAEVDYYWDALSADGGEPGQCGWLTDKFGISWQVVPDTLSELMSDPDHEKAGRVMNAMLEMNKIDIEKLEEAAKAK